MEGWKDGGMVGWWVVYLLIDQCDVLVPFPVIAAALCTYGTYIYSIVLLLCITLFCSSLFSFCID